MFIPPVRMYLSQDLLLSHPALTFLGQRRKNTAFQYIGTITSEFIELICRIAGIITLYITIKLEL